MATWCSRGSGASTFEFSKYVETLLGGVVRLIICIKYKDPSYGSTVERFKRHFSNAYVDEMTENNFTEALRIPTRLHAIIDPANVTHLYIQLAGNRPGKSKTLRHPPKPPGVAGVRIVVHASFDATQPWGDAFARVGAAVPVARGQRVPVVPLPLPPLPPMQIDSRISRSALKIPADATVFCGYGGAKSFGMPLVRRVVCGLAASARTGTKSPDIFFAFANIERFCPPPTQMSSHTGVNVTNGHGMPRLLHLRNLQGGDRTAFITLCDAMLYACTYASQCAYTASCEPYGSTYDAWMRVCRYAREDGETFGIAIAEFSIGACHLVPLSLMHVDTNTFGHVHDATNSYIAERYPSMRAIYGDGLDGHAHKHTIAEVDTHRCVRLSHPLYAH